MDGRQGKPAQPDVRVMIRSDCRVRGQLSVVRLMISGRLSHSMASIGTGRGVAGVNVKREHSHAAGMEKRKAGSPKNVRNLVGPRPILGRGQVKSWRVLFSRWFERQATLKSFGTSILVR